MNDSWPCVHSAFCILSKYVFFFNKMSNLAPLIQKGNAQDWVSPIQKKWPVTINDNPMPLNFYWNKKRMFVRSWCFILTGSSIFYISHLNCGTKEKNTIPSQHPRNQNYRTVSREQHKSSQLFCGQGIHKSCHLNGIQIWFHILKS